MLNEIPLVEDLTVPTIYFDGLAKAEVRSGVLRMVAYVCRNNPVTGDCERLPVAVLMRPEASTRQIQREIAHAARLDATEVSRVVH